MDCSYCILQQYFHPPLLQFFVNHQQLLNELDVLFSNPAVARIGTGEFTDSLIWEQMTDLSALLVPRFSRQTRAVLELKTKTAAVDNLKKIDHNQKTIVAWSLNTGKIIQTEERRTASLTERIRAAAKCESWGYPLAFHFDPMVVYDGWENDYRKVVETLFSQILPEKVVWISLGAFRFIPPLKEIMEERFPESRIAYGEFVSGMDRKMRYFKPLRIHMYQKMVGWLREIAPDVLIYFCMEDDEVWERSLGYTPKSRGGLGRMLDESAIRHCGLKL
jgi:spore photoproduct lyase